MNGEHLKEQEKIDKSFIDIVKLIIKPIKIILKILITFLAFLIFLFIMYILIEKYNSKKVYLKDDTYDVILCRESGIFDDHILAWVKAIDGYEIAFDIDKSDSEIYIKAYRERIYYKHPEKTHNYSLQMLVDIKKIGIIKFIRIQNFYMIVF